MLILAIETSCDETSAAVVQNGTKVLCNVIASSVEAFKASGGVIPEEAARKQVECILPVIHKALNDSHLTKDQLGAIAVTKGPGLLVSLLVGTTVARTLASLWHKPLIGVHHTLGHLSSTWLERETGPQFPTLTLSASGGHTELWLRTSHTRSQLLGSTRDDAAGEAFDKGAILLSLPYPGGPSIAKAAQGGSSTAYHFPLPLHDDDSQDFSFSGLKTSLKYLLQDLSKSQESIVKSPACPAGRQLSDIAASYQHAICCHLVDRLLKAARQYPQIKEIHLVGGVSANTHLRILIQETCPALPLCVPKKLFYCTDNAAMIASAAYFLHQEKGQDAFEPFETNASPAQ